MSVLARLYGPSAWLCIGSVTIFQRQCLRETSEDNVPQTCLLAGGEEKEETKSHLFLTKCAHSSLPWALSLLLEEIRGFPGVTAFPPATCFL